jgi:hypothetical protein
MIRGNGMGDWKAEIVVVREADDDRNGAGGAKLMRPTEHGQ